MSQTQIINPRSLEMDMHRLGRRIREMLKDGSVEVKVKSYNETRKVAQNRLLWMWHSELANHIKKHIGEIYGSEDIHDHVVGKLLPKRVVTVMGEPEIKRTETKKLTVKPFSQFLNTYEMWAAETYQCMFTRPDDLYWKAIMKDAA